MTHSGSPGRQAVGGSFESADQLQGYKPLHVTGEAGSSLRAGDGLKGVFR